MLKRMWKSLIFQLVGKTITFDSCWFYIGKYYDFMQESSPNPYIFKNKTDPQTLLKLECPKTLNIYQNWSQKGATIDTNPKTNVKTQDRRNLVLTKVAWRGSPLHGGGGVPDVHQASGCIYILHIHIYIYIAAQDKTHHPQEKASEWTRKRCTRCKTQEYIIHLTRTGSPPQQ